MQQLLISNAQLPAAGVQPPQPVQLSGTGVQIQQLSQLSAAGAQLQQISTGDQLPVVCAEMDLDRKASRSVGQSTGLMKFFPSK